MMLTVPGENKLSFLAIYNPPFLSFLLGLNLSLIGMVMVVDSKPTWLKAEDLIPTCVVVLN